MTSLPREVPDEPIGIVIRNGLPAKKPAVIWAYMWASDEEGATDHWHLHVPIDRAA
ncbi:MAG: hypothetical protein AB7Q69_02440 [Gemmatimonadales bacterium]